MLHSSPTTIRKYFAIPEDEIPKDRAVSRERQHQLARQQKQQEVDEARRLAGDGYPIGQIAAMMHHTYKTIQNYQLPVGWALLHIEQYRGKYCPSLCGRAKKFPVPRYCKRCPGQFDHLQYSRNCKTQQSEHLRIYGDSTALYAGLQK